jgi:cation:H+ antiporter
MGIILMAMVGLGLYLPNDIVLANWIGLMSLMFAVAYFLSVRIIFLNEQRMKVAQSIEAEATAASIPIRRIIVLYVANALVVVLAAMLLPGIAEALAEQLHLSQSIAGTLFLAAATTLPEATVSISAIRMGAYDLAVGNLIGSNLFNVMILTVDELFYTKGYLLKDASDNHIISVFAVIIMTAISISGLAFRRKEKSLLMAWDSLLIALIYIGNFILLYLLQ